MANCKKCNREIEGKRGDHICDTIRVEIDGQQRIMHRSRLNTDNDLKAKLDKGEAKVVERAISDPLRSMKDKFGRKQDPDTGAVLLEGTPNQ